MQKIIRIGLILQLLIFGLTGFAQVNLSNYGSVDPSTQQGKNILLKDYQPESIYIIPKTEIKHARFEVVDMHSHPYGITDQEIKNWIKTMDEMHIKKTIILTMATRAKFDSLYYKYSKYPDKFDEIGRASCRERV